MVLREQSSLYKENAKLLPMPPFSIKERAMVYQKVAKSDPGVSLPGSEGIAVVATVRTKRRAEVLAKQTNAKRDYSV